jgi:GTP-dependent dephospho-CoA kinase
MLQVNMHYEYDKVGNTMGLHFRLNYDVRKLIAYPMGELFTGPPSVSLEKAILWMKSIRLDLFSSVKSKSSPKIICVGDVISKAVIEHPKLKELVKYCFIDGGTQRGNKIEITTDLYFVKKEFHNPPGLINNQIFTFIKETLEDPLQYMINVIGEEDLLVLPAVLEANSSAFVFYGQPPVTDADFSIKAGCVGIHANPETRTRFKKVLDRFDQISV